MGISVGCAAPTRVGRRVVRNAPAEQQHSTPPRPPPAPFNPPTGSHELARDMRLTPLPCERLRASEARPVSRRLPANFHTSRKASPMFLLAAPPCSDTCASSRGGSGDPPGTSKPANKRPCKPARPRGSRARAREGVCVCVYDSPHGARSGRWSSQTPSRPPAAPRWHLQHGSGTPGVSVAGAALAQHGNTWNGDGCGV